MKRLLFRQGSCSLEHGQIVLNIRQDTFQVANEVVVKALPSPTGVECGEFGFRGTVKRVTRRH